MDSSFYFCFCVVFASVVAVLDAGVTPLDSCTNSNSLMLLAEYFPFNSKFLLALSLFLFLRRSGIVLLAGLCKCIQYEYKTLSIFYVCTNV